MKQSNIQKIVMFRFENPPMNSYRFFFFFCMFPRNEYNINQYVYNSHPVQWWAFGSHSRMAFRGRRCRSYYRILLFWLEIRIVSRGRFWQVLLGSTVWNALFFFFFFDVHTTHAYIVCTYSRLERTIKA